jgi:hypothetical protein
VCALLRAKYRLKPWNLTNAYYEQNGKLTQILRKWERWTDYIKWKGKWFDFTQ